MAKWILALVTVAQLGCGGSTAQQLCKDSAEARCSKLFECYQTAAEQSALMLGANANECTTLLQAECEPVKDGGTSSAQCVKPKLYDTAAASQCISEFKALKCDAVRMGSFPSSCGNVCK